MKFKELSFSAKIKAATDYCEGYHDKKDFNIDDAYRCMIQADDEYDYDGNYISEDE